MNTIMDLYYEIKSSEDKDMQVNAVLSVKGYDAKTKELQMRHYLWNNLGCIMVERQLLFEKYSEKDNVYSHSWVLPREGAALRFYTGKLSQQGLDDLLSVAKEKNVNVHEGIPEIAGNPLERDLSKEVIGSEGFFKYVDEGIKKTA